MSKQEDELEGYSGKVRELLKSRGVKTWDRLTITNGSELF